MYIDQPEGNGFFSTTWELRFNIVFLSAVQKLFHDEIRHQLKNYRNKVENLGKTNLKKKNHRWYIVGICSHLFLVGQFT